MGCTNSKPRKDAEAGDLVELSGVVCVATHKESQEPGHFIENIVVEHVNENIRDFYQIDNTDVLGVGCNGVVKKCIHRETMQEYALKTLSKSHFKTKGGYADLKREMKIMKELDHMNILRLHESFEDNNSIYLISELMLGGELLEICGQEHSCYSEPKASFYVFKMLSALKYLHAHNIVHRDLKLDNFLLEDSSENSELKLIDFGLSRYFKSSEFLSERVGTPFYVAPEVLKGKYDYRCDIWSIGVIAFMLLTGEPPFEGDNCADTMKKIAAGAYSFPVDGAGVSSEAKDFVAACLTLDYEDRPSAEKLLEHAWFSLSSSEARSRLSNVDWQTIQRLKTFQKRKSLGRVCMELVAHCTPSLQHSKSKHEFSKLDVDGSGEISQDELRSVMAPSLDQEDDVDEIFRSLDFDNSGVINYHEFLAAVLSRSQIQPEHKEAAFRIVARSKSYFDLEDLKNLLGGDFSASSAEIMFQEAGYSPEAKISYELFDELLRDSAVSSPLPPL